MDLRLGDCLEVLKSLPDDSVDALVTDPPAGISFMGKAWDDDKGGRDAWISWLAEILRECHRVMKPGAHGLVWALPRTSHWTGMALEHAGFEVRDRVSHLFGSGFPKSLDVSKAIDKAAGAIGHAGKRVSFAGDDGRVNPRVYLPAHEPVTAAAWNGWGTALKPAVEDWWLVRKPCSEKTVAANVLKWGTGALNIDGTRIAPQSEADLKEIRSERVSTSKGQFAALTKDDKLDRSDRQHVTGRFPSHLVLSHSPYCTDTQCDIECAIDRLDKQAGVSKSGANPKRRGADKSRAALGEFAGQAECAAPRGAEQGAVSRFFYCAKVSTSERNAGLEGMPDVECGIGDDRPSGQSMSRLDGRPPRVVKNSHPTVKPQKLMRYLCRLVTPPGGIILDPFMGSGSTGLAAKSEGFQFIGIEREAEYLEIARARINQGEIQCGTGH